MPAPIDFYFDFSSPFGYLASCKIDALAAKYDRATVWRPILLGAVFKVTGQRPLTSIPVKGDYARHDMARTARFLGVPYRYPTTFPISSVAPTRAFYWLNQRDPQRARQLAQALFAAYFTADIDISIVDNVVAAAAKLGLDAGEVRAGVEDQAIKDLTRAEVDKAVAAGVFGSPYIVVDGEPFWGTDRFDQLERWLATGGF